MGLCRSRHERRGTDGSTTLAESSEPPLQIAESSSGRNLAPGASNGSCFELARVGYFLRTDDRNACAPLSTRCGAQRATGSTAPFATADIPNTRGPTYPLAKGPVHNARESRLAIVAVRCKRSVCKNSPRDGEAGIFCASAMRHSTLGPRRKVELWVLGRRSRPAARGAARPAGHGCLQRVAAPWRGGQ